MKKKKNYCVECGGAQVNHRFTYISVLLGVILDPIIKKLENILPEESTEWMGPGFIKVFTFLGLGKITKKPNEKDSYRARVLWEEAERRGIDMIEFHMFNIGGDIFLSRYKNKNMRFFDVLPRPKKYNQDGLDWMDDKGEMKKHFKKAGIPIHPEPPHLHFVIS